MRVGLCPAISEAASQQRRVPSVRRDDRSAGHRTAEESHVCLQSQLNGEILLKCVHNVGIELCKIFDIVQNAQ